VGLKGVKNYYFSVFCIFTLFCNFTTWGIIIRNFAQDCVILRKKAASFVINSMASVRERTIPTERPPPVSEGSSANC
jgi:hypothetical protein